jgi:putative endonuclease
MYILLCADGSYYTGSTKKHLPIQLVYYEEYDRIDYAFEREKQIQKWRRKKKEALINGEFEELHLLARNYRRFPPR